MIKLVLGASIIINILFFILWIRKTKTHHSSTSALSADLILAQLPGHIYWKDKNGIMLGCNEQNWKDWGFKSLSEFIGKTDYEIFPKEQADALRANDNLVVQTQKALVAEESGLAADGSIMLMLSHKIPLRDHQNKIIGILGTSIEITKIKEAEIARLELLENIIAVTPNNVYWMDNNLVTLGYNDNVATFLGLKNKKDAIGLTYDDLAIVCDWRKNETETFKNASLKVIETGNPILNVEEPFAPEVDGNNGYFLTSRVPIKDKNNNTIGVVGISVDITERKKMEAQLLDAAVKEKQQEEKIRVMEIFAAGIAHELRTSLTAMISAASGITNFLPRLVEVYNMAEKAGMEIPLIRPSHLNVLKDTAEHIIHEGDYLQSVLTMMLSAVHNTKINTENFATLSMIDCIKESLKIYPFRTPEEKAAIHFDEKNDFQFYGDEKFTLNILFNLTKNALYFIAKAEKGEITIWLENKKSVNELHFKDTGAGIAVADLPHIFEEFFHAETMAPA